VSEIERETKEWDNGRDIRQDASLGREHDLVSMVVKIILTTNLLDPLDTRSAGLPPQAEEQRQT
jgi:hypothetical protein